MLNPAALSFERYRGPAFSKHRAASLAVAVLATSSIQAGTVNPPYQIGTWQGFRPAAVSYTFDDDLPNQYSIPVPMFNAKGFKMTLFTVTTWLPGNSWTPVQTAAAYGHEVASHTVTHPDLTGVYGAGLTNELQNSHSAINANVFGQECSPWPIPIATLLSPGRWFQITTSRLEAVPANWSLPRPLTL
jgi:peptidoglycan/xylan/chitin deacetylase (PgdA/CDA1 family)